MESYQIELLGELINSLDEVERGFLNIIINSKEDVNVNTDLKVLSEQFVKWAIANKWVTDGYLIKPNHTLTMWMHSLNGFDKLIVHKNKRVIVKLCSVDGSGTKTYRFNGSVHRAIRLEL